MKLPLRRLGFLGTLPPLIALALLSGDPSVRLTAIIAFLVLALLGITTGTSAPPGQVSGDPDPD